jgi:DNA modification methylase
MQHEAAMSQRVTLPVFHTTKLGRIYCADSLAVMKTLPSESIDLIMTSPPFGLTRKKEYGNEQDSEYLRWFRPFAEGFHRILGGEA